MITLGSKVRDRMTGIEGIAVARTEYIYGCTRIGVQPIALKDARPQDWLTFDEPQLEVLNVAAFVAEQPKGSKPGGPRQDLARRPDRA